MNKALYKAYQEILSKCADLECDLFYACEDDRDGTPLRELHEAIKNAMEKFAQETGVTL